MNRKISLFISIIFHPVFVNLLSLLLLFNLFPILEFTISTKNKFFYSFLIFITTGLFPLVVVGLLKIKDTNLSLFLNKKEERTIPYITTACWYLLDYIFCISRGAPHLFTSYLLACSCIVVAILIINISYKISIHSASLGALSAVLISSSQIANFDIRSLLAFLFMITGLTATARLFLNAHCEHQIYTGFLLGVTIMLLIL